MKPSRVLYAALPLALALAAEAHVTSSPSSDIKPQGITAPDTLGPLVATWMQDGSGHGRLTGVLIGANGGVRLHLDALLLPDPAGIIDNPMQVGVVSGQLYKDDGTDPLFAQSDLFVVGTWARLPDFGEASCLILRHVGESTAVEVIGRLQGTLDLSGGSQELAQLLPFPSGPFADVKPGPSDDLKPQGPSADVKPQAPSADVKPQAPSADIKPQAPSADVKPGPSDDAYQPAPGPDQVFDPLVAPFLGRWRING